MSELHLDAGTTPQRTHDLNALLRRHRLDDWWALAQERWDQVNHGDTARWHQAVGAQPTRVVQHLKLDASIIEIGHPTEQSESERRSLHSALQQLIPWRKGPFLLHGISIDAEWQCDMKWNRLTPHMACLKDRRVLDIGCNNGYFLMRMIGAGATLALGAEPAWLSHWQFAALTRSLPSNFPAWMIPARLEDLAGGRFDSIFSMGVLHHQRHGREHLRQLREHLEPGGELVLETLIIDTAMHGLLDIPDRYACMRNVYALMTPARIQEELSAAGFQAPRCVNRTPTHTQEQRSTKWMPFHSLREALDPHTCDQTIEGYPAPERAIFIART